MRMTKELDFVFYDGTNFEDCKRFILLKMDGKNVEVKEGGLPTYPILEMIFPKSYTHTFGDIEVHATKNKYIVYDSTGTMIKFSTYSEEDFEKLFLNKGWHIEKEFK